MLSRHKARQQAFLVIFERSFHDEPVPEIIEAAIAARDFETDEFTERLSEGVEAHIEELDRVIEKYAVSWNKSRISRVALSILRLSIYEILYMKEDVPVSVSINEAVELAKKFATDEDASFVNGILGSVAKAEGLQA